LLAARIPHIYFIYGLAFFTLGLAVALERGRALSSEFKHALRPLAVFGLLHGFHEWFEMFVQVGQYAYGFVVPPWLEWLRVLILALSFIILGTFGLHMMHLPEGAGALNLRLGLAMLAFYVVGMVLIGQWLEWTYPDALRAGDAWTRYTLGIPGALLAAWGFLIQRRIFVEEALSEFAPGLMWAALALALYGIVGQLVTSPSPLFPSNFINTKSFQALFGMPVQLFRAMMAVLIAFFTIRALRAFDVRRRQQLAAAQREAQAASARRNALRGELLRRAVTAQEEERKRVARELHDEIGQSLTGLATGLRGVQQSLVGDLDRVRLQLRQLEGMTVTAIGELSRLVTDLRPSILDDMGVQMALSWYVEELNKRSTVHIGLALHDCRGRLPPEVETTLFRIAQEALRNVVQHACADQAAIDLSCENKVAQLCIQDDGVGFDVETVMQGRERPGWGLVGICERVQLAGGSCSITSVQGEGTTICVEIPLTTTEDASDGFDQVDAG
jgi:signal transduction histidine kinase